MNIPIKAKKNDRFSYKEYVNNILSDTNSLSLSTYKNQFVPDVLYKYISFPAGRKHREKRIFALQDETIWFSKRIILNDPFEFQIPKLEFHQVKDQKFYERLLKRTAVLCLTTSPYNKQMWSHYADSHKGICIKFKVTNKSPLFPVEYVCKRPNYSEIFYEFMKAREYIIMEMKEGKENYS